MNGFIKTYPIYCHGYDYDAYACAYALYAYVFSYPIFISFFF